MTSTSAYFGEKPSIDVIIPAFNEEKALPLVLQHLPADWVRRVVVCDNGSTDATADAARRHGAVVVYEPRRGYGSACLAGMRYLSSLPPSEQPTVVVFLDGDYSDYPEELPNVAAPVLNGGYDMVVGSRMLGGMRPGAMTLPQRFGNWLAPLLIRWRYGYRFSDLGPFRAIRWDALQALGMRDPDYGWTVEMQIKAALHRLRCTEVPVRYRARAAGKSKVSGTLHGTVRAGTKILTTLFSLPRHVPQAHTGPNNSL
jgi:glycosyltransferase involved in cell wall biosynthesis